jgi:sec-independent protein translocase protein TatC
MPPPNPLPSKPPPPNPSQSMSRRPLRKRLPMSELAAASSMNASDKEQMPTMGFLDHLEELRKRLIYSIVAIAIGCGASWKYVESIYAIIQRPITEALQREGLAAKLVFLNPTEPFNLYLKVAGMAGLFIASPFVLYQIWCFISPGLYRNEKRYVMPFMASTIALFLAGGYFGYKIALPRALVFLIGFGKDFQPMITLSEYSSLFLTIIVGLGVIFEMPIVVFFLALMGIVTAGWMWRNIRYAILGIFVVAAIVTPTPDILNMCIFAAPMLALYVLSIAIAWIVHPDQRKKRAEKNS